MRIRRHSSEQGSPTDGGDRSSSAVICGVEVTRETVRQKVTSTWPLAESGEVLAELSRCEGVRIQIAILWLSQGSLDEVKRWVEIARADYRDVLFSAEHPPEEFPRTPEVQMNLGKIRGEHLKRYRAWLQDRGPDGSVAGKKERPDSAEDP